MEAPTHPLLPIEQPGLLTAVPAHPARRRRALLRRAPARRVVFLGGSRACARLREMLAGDAATLVGHMTVGDAGPDLAGRPTDADELRELVAFTRADDVVIDPRRLTPDALLELALTAERAGLRVSFLPAAG